MKSSSGIPRYHFSPLSSSLIPEHIVEYATTYSPLPAVDSTHNPDAYVGKTITSTFSTGQTYILGRYGGGKAAKVDHVIFTRYEVDVPAGATITGVKIKYNSTGVTAGTDDLDITGGFVLPGPSGGGWEDSTGVLEWTSWVNDVPLGQSFDGIYLAATRHSEVFAANTTASAGPAFESASTSMVTTAYAEYSFGDGITAVTDVTGLVDQLQNYIDNQESLRGHTVTGSIPVLVQLYDHFPSGSDNHHQGLFQQDYTGGAHLKPSLTVKYRSVEPPA
jgi:hypothetical protein